MRPNRALCFVLLLVLFNLGRLVAVLGLSTKEDKRESGAGAGTGPSPKKQKK